MRALFVLFPVLVVGTVRADADPGGKRFRAYAGVMGLVGGEDNYEAYGSDTVFGPVLGIGRERGREQFFDLALSLFSHSEGKGADLHIGVGHRYIDGDFDIALVLGGVLHVASAFYSDNLPDLGLGLYGSIRVTRVVSGSVSLQAAATVRGLKSLAGLNASPEGTLGIVVAY
jgi:hypothetical protein